jgi:hypothetical protein
MRAHVVHLVLLAAYFAVRAARWESVLLFACAALLVPARTRRFAAAAGLAIYVRKLAAAPFTAANHEFLEAWILGLISLVPARPEETARATFQRAIMVLTIVFFVFTGVQKVFHGYYLRGDFFAVAYAQPSKFSDALQLAVGEEERAEVAAYRSAFERHVARGVRGVLDLEPPRPRSVRILSAIACAVTLVAELILPLFLVPRRTRRFAAIELAIFFALVQAAAHEWMFGALVAVLLAPFFLRAEELPPPAPAPGLGTLLSLFVLWPACHLMITTAADISPWKLGGWGMYSVPARFGTTVVETRLPGAAGWRAFVPADEAERGSVYRRDYLLRNAPIALGAARELAGRALADPLAEPAPSVARVRVLTMLYDRATDRFHLQERTYVFGKGGP